MPDEAPAREIWWRRMVAPLGDRRFRWLWLAMLLTNLGTAVHTVGATWLMTRLAPAPSMVALVQAALAIPVVVFALPAGALADIWDRRRLMLAAQIGMMLVAVVITALSWLCWVTPALLLLATFLLAGGGAIHSPAWQSAVRQIVAREHFDAAIALNSVTVNIARSIGPALGGVVLALSGPTVAFAANGVSYMLLIALLFHWYPEPHRRNLPSERMVPAIVAGLRFAWMSPTIFGLLVRSILFGFGGSALWALMPIIARDTLAGGPLTYGFLFSALGAGAILGAMFRQMLGRLERVAVDLGFLAFGVSSILMGVIAWLPLALPVMFAAGICWIVVLSALGLAAQKSSPHWVVGRIVSLCLVATFVGISLGSIFWGQVARMSGVRGAMIGAGITVIASLVLRRRYALPSTDTLDLTPARDEPHDPIAGPLADGAGPLETIIEYRLSAAHADRFVAAMYRLGRMRQRDGARRWRLTRDIDDPQRWFERFESLNWTDNLRRQLRPTHADQALRNELTALHGGHVSVTRTLIVDPRTETHRYLDMSTLPPAERPTAIPVPPLGDV